MPFDPLRYRDPIPSAALISVLSPFNRIAALRGLMRVRALDLPAADERRLHAAVHRGTAAFLAPNHPEYLTDWLIDKEISARVSPQMAHWATYRIVNANPAAQAFFLRCNLIANVPGGEGRAYSVRWAAHGHGVLLHPEGQPTGQSDRIGPLFPGVVEMARETAKHLAAAGAARDTWIVPLVWKLRFESDVTRGLAAEMDLIEEAAGVGGDHGAALESRFASLLTTLLRARAQALHLPVPDDAPYFDAQQQMIDRIWSELESRYPVAERDFARAERSLLRALRDAPVTTRARDRALIAELGRLVGFAPELYGGAMLTQESIAESLKRLRFGLPLGGRRHALHNALPRPVGARLAHVRVPEPLPVHASDAEDAGTLELLRTRLAQALADLVRELEPLTSRWARPNPLRTNPSA